MIKVNLVKSSSRPISLLEILKEKLKESLDFSDNKIIVTIDSNIEVNIEDDLLDADIYKLNLEFVLSDNAKLNYIFKHLNENSKLFDIVDRNLRFKLFGEYSSVDAKVLVLGCFGDRLKFKTIQEHFSSHSRSNLVVKSVLDGKASIVSDNIIIVNPGLKKVEANQINKNILLSDHSHVVSIPKLEIESDDVKCFHGAAISRFDNDVLFYLQSRGLTLDKSRDVLINSFLK